MVCRKQHLKREAAVLDVCVRQSAGWSEENNTAVAQPKFGMRCAINSMDAYLHCFNIIIFSSYEVAH